MIDLRLFRHKSDGEIEEVTTHEALDVLDKVNETMTRYDLFETTGSFLELTGESFWWLIKNEAGKIVSIYPWLSPDRMQVIPDDQLSVKGYVYIAPNGGQVPFTPDEIVHFKYTNPENPYRGLSPLKAAEYAVATDAEAMKWNWRFFKNQARPSGVIEVPDSLTQEQYERAIAQWEAGHKGSDKAHRLAIVEGGAKYTDVGFGQKEMDFIEQRRFSRDEMLAIFKVPKSILGLTEEINRATAEAQKAVFLEEVIFPIYHKLVGYLNEFYLSHWGDDELFFDFANQAPREVTMLMTYYQNGLANGWLAPNEVREMEGLTPYEGGENIYMPFSLSPVGTAPEKTKMARPKFKRYRRTRAQVIKDAIKEEIKGTMAVRLKSVQSRAKEQAAEDTIVFPKSLFKTYKARDQYWEAKMRKIAADEKTWRKKMSDVFLDQEKRVLESISEKAFKTAVRFQFDVDDEVKVFTTTFTPLLKTIIKREGQDAIDAVTSGDFDITTEGVNGFIQRWGLERAKGINETTREEIKRALKAGTSAGEGVAELRDRVKDVFERATDSRAETIARTEVNRASNFAQIEGFEQSGVVKEIEWLTAGDERVDEEICDPMDGETVKLGDDWTLPNGEKVDVPQDAHPNCRCTTLPVIDPS